VNGSGSQSLHGTDAPHGEVMAWNGETCSRTRWGRLPCLRRELAGRDVRRANPRVGTGGRKVDVRGLEKMQARGPQVPQEAKQGPEAQDPRWSWVEASIWNERMLAALGNGVKGGIGAGPMPSSPSKGCSPCMQPMHWRASLDEVTTDWRAVCGRTARTVRREGMADAIPYPYPRCD
jgi:hypothetical protein